MLASVDPFLARRHRGDAYNCLHFARDVWQAHVGVDIGERLKALREGAADRRVHKGDVAAFEALDGPQDPCLVLLWQQNGGDSHVGVYLRGRLLHLTEKGVRFERLDLALDGYASPRFYR
ncbi:MAG TPA: hypothetical protein VHZ78_08530 [Rhizomicrobium sp.]|jgi:hypothetical protein|nr:hypothetical protein [Rhizomicrobium sp.]